MPRISLPPSERRTALLTAAEDLFLTQGFEATQVSQVVKKIGAAQGTFYNYFDSKEDVLSAVFENLWQQFLTTILHSLPEGAAIDRLKFLLMGIFHPPAQTALEPERWQALTRLIAHPTAHNLWDDARIKVLGPQIQQIVLDGINEGLFIPYTQTAASIEIIFLGINTYLHQHADSFDNPQDLAIHLTAVQEVLARSLGIAPEQFQLIPPAQ